MADPCKWLGNLTDALGAMCIQPDLNAAHEMLHKAERILFIGNGGSAAIASHLAVDFQKNGGVTSMAFNDAPMLTCLANDYEYAEVFAKQIGRHAMPGDVLVAISSSGRSPNILRGVTVAHMRGCRVITLSGFDYDNPLRSMGAINFYIASHDYGHVEISSLAVLHSLVEP